MKKCSNCFFYLMQRQIGGDNNQRNLQVIRKQIESEHRKFELSWCEEFKGDIHQLGDNFYHYPSFRVLDLGGHNTHYFTGPKNKRKEQKEEYQMRSHKRCRVAGHLSFEINVHGAQNKDILLTCWPNQIQCHGRYDGKLLSTITLSKPTLNEYCKITWATASDTFCVCTE